MRIAHACTCSGRCRGAGCSIMEHNRTSFGKHGRWSQYPCFQLAKLRIFLYFVASISICAECPLIILWKSAENSATLLMSMKRRPSLCFEPALSSEVPYLSCSHWAWSLMLKVRSNSTPVIHFSLKVFLLLICSSYFVQTLQLRFVTSFFPCSNSNSQSSQLRVWRSRS